MNRLSGSDASPSTAWWLFATGAVFYVVMQVGLLICVDFHRDAPVEVDDAYDYTLKAVEMLKPGIDRAEQTLWEQYCTFSGDAETDSYRYRGYLFIHYVYHPLYSWAIIAAHAAGLGWESALTTVQYVGSILIAAGSAVFLLTLFGPGPAGLGLLMLGVTVYARQGVCYVTPGNVCLGLALMTWSAAVGTRRHSLACVMAGVCIMLALHPVGRLYAIGAAILWFLLGSVTWCSRFCHAVIIGALTLTASLVFTFVMNDPCPIRDPDVARFGFLTCVRENLRAIPEIVRHTAFLSSWPIIAAILAAAGAVTLDRKRRMAVAVSAGMVVLMLAVSVLHALQLYRGELFSRIWIAAAIIISGLIGQSAWSWLLALALRVRQQGEATASTHAGLTTLIAGGILLASAAGLTVYNGAMALLVEGKRMIERHNMRLDLAQPGALAELMRPGDDVLYLHDTPMYFYLTRGLLGYGAIHQVTLGPDTKGRWLEANPALKYVVGFNPVRKLELARWGLGARIRPGDEASLELGDATDLRSINLYLQNAGLRPACVTAEIVPGGNAGAPRKTTTIPVPPGGNWQTLELGDDQLADGSIVSLRVLDSDVVIGGIRLDPSSSLWWPWGRRVKLGFRNARGETDSPILFEITSVMPALRRQMKVLQDKGATFFASIEPEGTTR